MLFGMMRQTLGGASEDFVVEALTLGQAAVSQAAERAIDAAKKGHRRDCPLKPLIVVWLVLLMQLHRNLSIPNVFKQIVALIQVNEPRLELATVDPTALHHARRRLGSEPMRLLFQELARQGSPWSKSFHGLRVFGADGFLLRAPDTEANEEEFGRKRGGRGASGYPQLLAVSLVDTTTHKIVDIVFLHCNASERTGLRQLMDGSLGTGDLLLMDRGLSSFGIFLLCLELDVRFLARIPSSWKVKVIKRYDDGDCLVEIRPCKAERTKLKAAGLEPKVVLTLRMLSYQIGAKGEKVRLITDLVKPELYDARELALLYHKRWEAELAIDELKTHFATVSDGKQPTHFRSKKPEGVRQEAYGLMIAYNLVRDLMVKAARTHDLEPLQLSFVDTIEVIKLWCPRLTKVAALTDSSDILQRFLRDIAACRLRPRQKRRCPRGIKIKMSKYHLKRPGDEQENIDFEAELRLVDA